MSAAKDAMHLADASRIIGKRLPEWPAEFMPAALAALLAGGFKGACKENFLQWRGRIRTAIESEPPILAVRIVRKPAGEPWARGGMPKPWGQDAFGCVTFSEDQAKTRYWVAPPAFAEWLASIEHDPPEYLIAWLGAAWVQVSRSAIAKVGAGGTADCSEEIPGKLPKVAIGKLAIKAAWQIECETKRAATAAAVISKLQDWADAGECADVLSKSDKQAKAVYWITSKSAPKKYDQDACVATLKTWQQSRR